MLLALSVGFFLLQGAERPLAAGTALEFALQATDAAQSFSFASEVEGTLAVWATSSEFDPALRVEDAAGVLLKEDQDSGGGKSAFLELELAGPTNLRIRVASTPAGGSGKGRVCAVLAPETAVTRAAAVKARERFAELGRLRGQKQLAAARTLAQQALEELLATPGAGASKAVAQAGGLLGKAARELGLSALARGGMQAGLDDCERRLPPDHPDLQEARNQLAGALMDLGENRAALALDQLVLAAYQRTLAPDDLRLPRAQLNVGLAKKYLGDMPGAYELERQALEGFERLLPEEHLEVQRARINFAGSLRARGDREGARAIFEKTLDILQRTQPADHPWLRVVRANLAVVVKELGDFQSARPLEEQVLAEATRLLPDDHPELQAARQNLASTLKALGEIQAALALEEKVLDVRTKTLPPDNPDLIVARGNLALTLGILGDHERARALQEEVLDAIVRVYPADHPDVQWARMNLAMTLAELGDHQRARALYEQVLEVRTRLLPPDDLSLQSTKEYLACSLRPLGDVQGARVLLEDVLRVYSRKLPEGNSNLGTARFNLAATMLLMGDARGARELFEQLEQSLAHTRKPEDPDLREARRNLASALIEQKDFEKARTLLQAVLRIDEAELPPDDPNLQMTRLNLASACKQLGQLEGASVLEEQALEAFRRLPPADPAWIPAAWANLARTLALRSLQDGKPDPAREARFRGLAAEFTRSLQQSASEAVLAPSRREAEERAASLSEGLSHALSLALGLGVFAADPVLLRDALQVAETRRAAGLSSVRLARAAAADPSYAKLRVRLQAAAAELARVASAGASAQQLAQARAQQEQAERELQSLAEHAPGSVPAALAPDFDALGAALAPDQALVGYVRYHSFAVDRSELSGEPKPDHLCALVLRRGKPLACVDLGAQKPVQDAVDAWLDALGAHLERGQPVAGDEHSEALRRGTDLRKLVFDPLLPALGDARHLVVALDDVLHLVPLDALPAAEPERLLGDRWRIDTRTCLVELDWPAAAPPAGCTLLALGHPDFDREPAQPDTEDALVRTETRPREASEAGLLRGSAWERGFRALPETSTEVHGIADYFAGAFREEGRKRVLEDAQASRANLVAAAPGARWLHIAAHGWYAPESVPSWDDPLPIDQLTGLGRTPGSRETVERMSPMLLCGLALAGANLPQDSSGRIPGLVTAEELCTLDLSNCELAVLSACDTSAGVQRCGMGIASLQRALQIAGARSVISSRWGVGDQATKELMLDFYRRLWAQKKPKWQALWEAKCQLRNAKDPRGRPRYTTRDWAAWVLTGVPD